MKLLKRWEKSFDPDRGAAAERAGLIDSSVDFVAARRLRNRLVHDYSSDIATLAMLLDQAHGLVPFLTRTQASLAAVLGPLAPPSPHPNPPPEGEGAKNTPPAGAGETT